MLATHKYHWEITSLRSRRNVHFAYACIRAHYAHVRAFHGLNIKQKLPDTAKVNNYAAAWSNSVAKGKRNNK
jgi:hypothetical protein